MSIKITFRPEVPKAPGIINVRDVPIGTVFTGVVGASYHGLFVRHYGGVIMLDNPNISWAFSADDRFGGPSVKEYRARDIEVVVS